MKKNIAFVLAAILGITSLHGEEAAPAPKTSDDALGANGLITHWLVLGYLPGIKSPETDRLESIGGEATVTPFGGQSVILETQDETQGDLALTWKPAEVKRLEMPYWAIQSKALHLFADEKGNPIQGSQAYAYSALVSGEDRNLVLKMYGGEPIRIWLNGEPVEISDRSNRLSADAGMVAIALKKGNNRLLVRINNVRGNELLSMRLVDENNQPVENVRVQLKSLKNSPELTQTYLAQDWDALIAEIPPLAKSEDEPSFGTNISRAMTLLETGVETKRPVRIFFYGQSITASSWPFFLIRHLRERYPDTEIIAYNRARSGWQIDKLNRAIEHDILTAKPDLVVLHAYGGDNGGWEQIIQKIRRETTADIMVRTAHIAGRDIKPYNEKGMPILWRDEEWKERDAKDDDESVLKPIPEDDSYSLEIRRVAQKYGCELVECRKDWLSYIRTHGMMHRLDLLSDGLHLNNKGCILMAQMYERHFKRSSISEPQNETVRRYNAIRSPTDSGKDEIELIGDGWNTDNADFATSTGKNDMLKLKFHGNRVDLVMPPGAGKAKVLINGKTPSELNILHRTFPVAKGLVPAYLMTYHIGENAVEEAWTLQFTHLSGDYRKYRFTVTGSKTGFDGEGDNSNPFVSNSGRIKILNNDFNPNVNVKNLGDRNKKEPEPVVGELMLNWSLHQPYPDEVSGQSNPRYYQRYVTVIDGLSEGEHELTLIPEYSGKEETFSIEAVEIHCPPLWEK